MKNLITNIGLGFIIIALFLFGFYKEIRNNCEKEFLKKEQQKAIEVKNEIIYVKTKQAKIALQPTDNSSRSKFLFTLEEKRSSK